MTFYHRYYILAIIVLLGLSTTYAQTCCTGSAPITGSIKLTSLEKHKLNFSLLYDYNNISDIYLGTTKVNEDYLARATHTIIAQTNYGVTDKLNVSLIVPFVSKSETATTNSSTLKQNAGALGDISLLAQYLIATKDAIQLMAGLGFKVPTGATQLTAESTDIVLQPTLQPGTGSFDYFFLTKATFLLPKVHGFSIEQTLSYQLTTPGSNFAAHSSYEFGNEFLWFNSFVYQFAINKTINTPTLTLKLSNLKPIKIENITDPNSGGTWLYVSPGWNVALTEMLSLFAQAEIPIFRNPNGFQLITKYKFNTGISITI